MIIDTFDKELEEIGVQVDLSIESADEHLNQRLGKGEAESVTLSVKSHDNNDQRSEVSTSPSVVQQRRLEAQEANERLWRMQQEQEQQEDDLQRRAAQLQLTKQRTEEARKIAALNQARANAAEQEQGLHPASRRDVERRDAPFPSWQHHGDLNQNPMNTQRPVQRIAPIRLKGVELPKFSGEDKTGYE